MVRKAVCPTDSAHVNGIAAQQVMYVSPGEWSRRPSLCLVGDLHVMTAGLIPWLDGHLLGGDTHLTWADTSWAADSLLGDGHLLGGGLTSWLTDISWAADILPG